MNFYEFFAGGGMARLGLGASWRCAFANDIDSMKAASYRSYFDGADELRIGDVAEVLPSDLPGHADLAWASFPCQDLSLAGNGGGLKGKRSGTFWLFWKLIQALGREGRPPKTIVLENVQGAVTSHKGRDFAAICEVLAEEDYQYAPLVIDAQYFLPQSRPRLFIVGFKKPEAAPPASLLGMYPASPWHPDSFGLAYNQLSDKARASWTWLRLPTPAKRESRLADIIEQEPAGVEWHSPFETKRLLTMMSPLNREKVAQAKRASQRMMGAVYKRTRKDSNGAKCQRAEVRFDDVAGCLRTPAGGSSRQIILVVEGKRVRSRLFSPREAARLMGLPEDYTLPKRYNDAYRLAGDGVAVPVVEWLARHVIEPALITIAAEEVA